MKIHTKCLLGTLLASVALIGSANAEVITTGSSVQGENNWFTAGYSDGALGGYVFFDKVDGTLNTPEIGLRGGVLDAGGAVGVTINAAAGNDAPLAAQSLENPAGGTFESGAWFNVGVQNDNRLNVATLTFDTGSPTSATIGVLVGASEFADGAPSDFPQKIALNGVEVAVSQPAGDITRADWYFFNVTDISVGDTITISSSRIADAGGHKFNPVNGVVISAVPEPGSMALLGLGGLLVARRRRRN